MELDASDFFLLFSTALVTVGFLTPLARRLAFFLTVLDLPSESHKTHQQPVPYLGGVAIMIGSVFTTYSAILVSGNPEALSIASTVMIPAVLMGIIGLVDDIRKLGPFPRFIAQNIVAVAIAGVLLSTNTFGSPTGMVLLDLLLSVLWIVGITNSINFFDNIDGGASGTVAISTLFLFVLAFMSGQYFIGGLSIVVSGATIGFLIWNRPPARIYMGDAGALFLGLLLATLTIRFDPNPIFLSASFAIPFLLLAVPILDTTVAVLSRIRRGVSPFQGGQDHLSHRLMRLGLNKRKSILTLWLLSIFFCSFALAISNSVYTLERFLVVIGGICWLMLLVFFLFTKDDQSLNQESN